MPQQRRFYGDLVNGICYTVFLPVYTYLWWMEAVEKATIIASTTTASVVSTTGQEDVVEDSNAYYYYCHEQQQHSSDMTLSGVCTTSTLATTTTTAHDVAFHVLIGPRNIVFAFYITAICCWYSHIYSSNTASTLALLGMSASIAFMNLYSWPYINEVVVIPQFFW
jgi:hypothetical protein